MGPARKTLSIGLFSSIPVTVLYEFSCAVARIWWICSMREGYYRLQAGFSAEEFLDWVFFVQVCYGRV